MKRIIKFKTAAFLLLSLHGYVIAVGQVKQGTDTKPTVTLAQSTRTQPKSTYSEPQFAWEPTKTGVSVLRLWGKKDLVKGYTEVAILRLTDEQYKEFKMDPRMFLLKNDIFQVPKLNTFFGASELVPGKVYQDAPGDYMWMVMVEHDYSASNSASAAVELFPSTH